MKKSTDIYFASAMLALGANLVHVDRTDPRHMSFEFESKLPATTVFDSENLPKLMNTTFSMNSTFTIDLDSVETQWANGTLMVNATQYADALKRMKSVVHSRD